MIVHLDGGETVDLGATEVTPTVSLYDFSRRETDDFGVTTIVKRGFSRRMSVRLAVPTENVDAVQRRLADLRATSALWVADERFQWLNVVGLYKDFELTLPGEALSFCTLSVEGLAETEVVSDDGSDPAASERPSTLMQLRPIAITDATLLSSSVPENDAPAWVAGTTYPKAARVIRSHRVFESLIVANASNEPTTSPAAWLDIGPANRWAMFDQALGTVTTGASPLVVALPAGQINALALLDVNGAQVRVQAQRAQEPHYDRTIPVAGGPITFLDLLGIPSGNPITITVTGSGPIEVGTLLAGSIVTLGTTEAAPTAGITDFSKKEVDDFGEVTIVPRAWSKKASVRSLIRTDALDVVANRLAAVRAVPCLWIAEDGRDVLTIYGFAKEWSIEVGQNTSKVALAIEGLSKAAKIKPPAAVVAQGSADGVTWHLGLEPGDVFMRLSNDGGATYGDAIRILGEDGAPGEDGSYQQLIFQRSATQPATPTGGGVPAGWSDGVPPGTDLIWMSVQYQRNGIALGPWSTPAQIKGDKGENGLNGGSGLQGPPGANGQTTYVHFAYADSADGSANFTTGAADGRFYVGVYVDFIAADSGDYHAYTWSLQRGANGANGTPGPAGANGLPSYVHIAYANSANGQKDFHLSDPTGRAFIGVYSDQILADSNDPAVYTWSIIQGASAVTLVPHTATTIVDRNSVRNIEAAGWGASAAHSKETFSRGAVAQWSVPATNTGNCMAGLAQNTDSVSNSFDSITFAIFRQSDGYTDARINGTSVAPGPNVGAGDARFMVQFDHGTGDVGFYVNGNRFHAYPWGKQADPLCFRAALASAGAAVTDITLQASAATGADGAPGLQGPSGVPGTNGTNGANGAPGANGQTSYVHFAYADSPDGSVNFTIGAAEGRYYVGVYTDFSAPDSGDYRTYTWSLLRGANGANGIQGPPGANGQTTYVHVAYASSADGSVNFSVDDPTGRTYIGVRTDYVLADSGDYRDYTWSLIKGADGANGANGANGQNGAPGPPGTNGTNGVDGFSIETQTPIFAIPCFSNGNPDPARWSGGSGQAQLRKAGAAIGGVSYSVPSQSGMTSLSVNAATGAYSFSGISADAGFFVIRAGYAGQTYDLKIDVKKVRDGSPAFKASSIINGPGTTAATTTVPAGRIVRVSASVSYYLNHEGYYTARLSLYARNITDNGPDMYLGQVDGSQAYRINTSGNPFEPEYDQQTGLASASFTFNSSTAGDKEYQYRCFIDAAGGGYADNHSGTLSLEVIA